MKTPDIPPDEDARLAELRSLNVLDTIAEERFDRLTRMAKRLFGVDVALVSLVDESRQWFKSCAGMELSETPRGRPWGWLLRRRRRRWRTARRSGPVWAGAFSGGGSGLSWSAVLRFQIAQAEQRDADAE